MKTAAIICEFNPFHEGHKYLIDSVRRDLDPGAVVCIMSGNYVQRGRPALWNKWERVEAALKGGADLVLQMPVCVSLSSAKYFAKGAVDIAKAMSCSWLCFGAESGDLERLRKLADEGIEEIEEGNTILACEYLRNLDGSIIPYTVALREDLGHASDIRKDSVISFEDEMFKLISYKVISSDPEDLSKAPEVSEGLENKVISELPGCSSLEELIQSIKSKRYTYTRISRMLMQIMLGIDTSVPESVYAHVLGFNETGRKVLSEIARREDKSIRLYSDVSPKDACENKDLATDVRADDIYSVLNGSKLYSSPDYVCKPVISDI